MLNTDRLCPGCMNDNGGNAVCPICGYTAKQQNPAMALPIKFWLNDRYWIGKVLSADSEGITYLGWDNAADRAVSVQEYFPDGIAFRNPDRTVSMHPEKKYVFNEGLLDFLTLNRKLIPLDLPSLPKTDTVFEENGTAYAIRTAIAGKRFETFLNENGGRLKWEQARPLFLPLIDTLSELHNAGIVHAAVSPETVWIGRDGILQLDHFCILQARHIGTELSPELFDGYAAPEQYNPELLPDAMSDVYGLSALLFRTLIGNIPPAANIRLQKECLSVPAHFADELPRQVLVALANGLQLQTEKRTKTVITFRDELVYGETAEATRSAAKTPKPTRKTNERPAVVRESRPADEPKSPKKKINKNLLLILISAGGTALICFIIFLFARQALGNKKGTGENPASDTSQIASVAENAPKVEVPKLDDGETHFSKVKDIPECDDFKITYQYEANNEYSAGIIIKQSTVGGQKLGKGSQLILTVSLGPETVRVPNIVGMTEREAWETLQKAGLTNIEVMDIDRDSSKAGKVVSQNIKSGEYVSPNEFFHFDVQVPAPEEPEETIDDFNYDNSDYFE